MTAGNVELGIAGGYSVSFNNDRPLNLPTVYGTHGLLRVGGFVREEHGSNIVRGNLELTLEPTYIHLDSHSSADVYGVALLGAGSSSGMAR